MVTKGVSSGEIPNSDLLARLDKETLEALAQGEINEQVALLLASVPDVKDRRARLTKAREIAAQRIEALRAGRK